jgi:hypothetical protein
LLYILWLPRRDALATALPSTGKVYVDVALQGFAAAVLGKLVFFSVSILWAIVDLVIVGRVKVASNSEIRRRLAAVFAREGQGESDGIAVVNALSPSAVTDKATLAVWRLWPNGVGLVTRARTDAFFSYACAIICLPLTNRLAEATHAPMWVPFLVGLTFLVLGVLHQSDYVAELARALHILELKPPPPETK